MPVASLEDMPILRQLVTQAQRSKVPLHVPGHKQGRLLPGVFSEWLGAASRIDLTELAGLDNLHLPTGCILQSQRYAALHYGAHASLFSVNGSTAAIIAALMSTAHQGRVLFLNSPHTSAWRGLVLADGEAVFAPVSFDGRRFSEQAPSLELAESILRTGGFTCMYVTSPTYTGAVAPIRQLAEVAHRHGIPLIVDEAHGAHFGLVPEMPEHSVEAGADVVVHSVHKMLPGLTQTAWLHVQGELVDVDTIAQSLSMLQTTSPSYLLLASLDAAQAWLRKEGKAVVARSMSHLAPLQEASFVAGSGVYDPFRHWVPTGSLRQSKALERYLAEQGIFVEYADALGVLSIFGLDASRREVNLYSDTLNKWLALQGTHPDAEDVPVGQLFSLLAEERRPLMRPRETHFQARTWVPAKQAAGRICGLPITPYPPGVPLLWPGQVITGTVLRVLRELVEGGYEVHGLGNDGEIPVYAM
ncbi:MAG: hypothetical protein A2201_06025 [Alicyclobacillus sp. RIFOXYA1_FULL_53_8]|nr:MAG: hypothetical protein A2201_06025 [Alicyclobacillus sp. RIFOXYA1_FULL_53_8]